MFEIIDRIIEHCHHGNVLVVMAGMPGSGKTYYSDLIIKAFDNKFPYDQGAYHSSDFIMEVWASYEGITYDEVYARDSKAAFKLFDKDTDNYYDIPETLLVWDQTNLTKKKRKKIISRFRNKYDKIFCVMVHSDKAKKRRDARIGKTIPSHVLKSMEASIDIPSPDEGFDDIFYIND